MTLLTPSATARAPQAALQRSGGTPGQHDPARALEAICGPLWTCSVVKTQGGRPEDSYHDTEIAADRAEDAAKKAGAYSAVAWRIA